MGRPDSWSVVCACPVPVRILSTLVLVSALGGALTLAGGTAESAAGKPASTWTARPATYQVVTEKDRRIEMSDGTVFVADVLRPGRDGVAVDGRFPVLLTQTPYNKNLRTENHAVPYLVERGYVQVIADVRGTGGSQGDWLALGEREQRDGLELVAWAASKQRPWSDGRVGTYGISYAGINQLLTAAQRPPALKATFPIVASGGFRCSRKALPVAGRCCRYANSTAAAPCSGTGTSCSPTTRSPRRRSFRLSRAR